jgi:prefoldin beta subunit
MDKETEKQLQELQIMEQNLQNISMQKQAFTLELNELESSLEELKNSGDEVYKIVGQVMFKASRTNLEKESKEKKELISVRLKSIEEQEKTLSMDAENLRKKVLSKIQK